jgi:pyruvate/2-oxoglutarate dehydrogenase complex dihydrolipoamide dehydrogenase (E3) component
MVKKSGAVIMLNTEITPEFLAAQGPDVLIVAVGAAPIVPDMPGIKDKKVIMAEDVYRPTIEIGNKVVIMGGGLVGVEEAINLAMQGKVVTVVEMLDEIARDSNRLHKIALNLELEKFARNLKVVTRTRGKEVNEWGLVCEGPDGREVFFEADSVICAVGYKPLTMDFDQMRGSVPEFYCIGDCVRPGKVFDAIHTAYDTAINL